MHHKFYKFFSSCEAVERFSTIPAALLEAAKERIHDVEKEYHALGERSEYVRELLGVPNTDSHAILNLNK